jgi:hypothetical protein
MEIASAIGFSGAESPTSNHYPGESLQVEGKITTHFYNQICQGQFYKSFIGANLGDTLPLRRTERIFTCPSA